MIKLNSLEKELSVTASGYGLEVMFFGRFVLETSDRKVESWKFEFNEKAASMLSDGDRRAQAMDEHIAFLKYKYRDFSCVFPSEFQI